MRKSKSSSIDNIINYKSIFSHNRKIDKTIMFLKKTEFDIFYSCKCKYPILVKETINASTGYTSLNIPIIIRSNIVDPFQEDLEIPKEYRHTLNDYKEYMEYGGSLGHNAPAGQHKTNMSVYTETYFLSNITPQEMVFNSGLWALIENWCKDLQKNKKLLNTTVFTGSIPSKKNSNFNGVIMNVPQKMFKIVCFQHIDKPNTIFMEIILANNTPEYINPNTITYDFSKYLVPYIAWNWFEKFSGIDIKSLLTFYGFNINTHTHTHTHTNMHTNKHTNNTHTQANTHTSNNIYNNLYIYNIKPFRNLIQVKLHLYQNLKQLMKKSNWYGYLIYAKTLNELDEKWDECKTLEKEFKDMQYYKDFYNLARIRLIKEADYKQIPNIYSLSNINNQLIQKYKFDKSVKSVKSVKSNKNYASNKFTKPNKFTKKHFHKTHIPYFRKHTGK